MRLKMFTFDMNINKTQPIFITACLSTIRFTLNYQLIVDKFIICLLKTVIYSNNFMKFSPESCSVYTK